MVDFVVIVGGVVGSIVVGGVVGCSGGKCGEFGVGGDGGDGGDCDVWMLVLCWFYVGFM